MNRAQKRQLQAYLHFRNKRMSVLALIRFNWRIFLLMVALGVISAEYMLWLQQPFFAWLYGFACSAVVLRDIGQCIRWSRTWPMTKELLDWSKVEQLALKSGLAA